MKYKTLYLLPALLCCTTSLLAQTQKIVADKIIAHVGDKIVLNSDVKPEYCISSTDGETTRCYMLKSEIYRKALAIQATKDSINITDDEVNNAVDERLSMLYNGGGIDGIKKAGVLKRDIFQTVKEQLLANMMQQKLLRNTSVTPAEVRAYFDKTHNNTALLIDSSFEASQLIIYPKPSKDVTDYIVTQLQTWKHDVETGKQKFDILAKLYSMDPGSNIQGGTYALSKHDKQWDATWFNAAWQLKEGQVSGVVKSSFGYHIIQMVSRVGDEAVVRHILLVPSITPQEKQDALNKLDSIRSQIVAGTLSFGEAVNRFDEDNLNRANGGQLKNANGLLSLSWDEIERHLVKYCQNLQAGEISQPITYKNDRQQDAVSLIQLRKRTPAHTATLAEDYATIAAQALEDKQKNLLKQWFSQQLATINVSVDNSYADCNFSKFVKDKIIE